jgi:hypothetical protein
MDFMENKVVEKTPNLFRSFSLRKVVEEMFKCVKHNIELFAYWLILWHAQIPPFSIQGIHSSPSHPTVDARVHNISLINIDIAKEIKFVILKWESIIAKMENIELFILGLGKYLDIHRGIKNFLWN